MRGLKKNAQTLRSGFTLIELLVVIAIISLLASIVLIGLMQARQKSRNAKRLADMTQMNTALELYFAQNKGYPSATGGIPQGITTYASTLPRAPIPDDGVCTGLTHSSACSSADPSCSGVAANTYYYVPSGTSAVINGNIVYPDYAYFFCLGNPTGNFGAGERILSPTGVK